MSVNDIKGSGWPKGHFPAIDKMVNLAKTVDPDYREIKNSKQELERLTGGLTTIKDKARVLRRGDLKAQQKGNKDKARQKRLANLAESVADLGLSAGENAELNIYQKIGAAQGALRVIRGMEDRGPNAVCTAAQGITCDKTKVKDSALGRLTGANARHNAQRIAAMENTGLEAMAKLAEFTSYQALRFLLGAGAAPHATLHAIGIAGWHCDLQDYNAMPIDSELLAFETDKAGSLNPSDTRENLKPLAAICDKLAGKTSNPQGAWIGKISGEILADAAHRGRKQKNAWKELGIYRGALNAIYAFTQEASGANDEIIASCAKKVLEQPLEAEEDKNSSRESDRKYAGYRRTIGAWASDRVLAYEVKGGLAAVELLSERLNCRDAKDILKQKLSPQEKLEALSQMGRSKRDEEDEEDYW